MTTALTDTIEFYFDPGCPWTSMTSRWLVEAAGQRDIEIEWRSLSLGVLDESNEIPEAYRAALDAGGAAHRVIAALLASGRNDLVGAFYTAYGRRTHRDGEAPSIDLVRIVADAAGAGEWSAAVEDAPWDAAVRESTHLAVGLAGPTSALPSSRSARRGPPSSAPSSLLHLTAPMPPASSTTCSTSPPSPASTSSSAAESPGSSSAPGPDARRGPMSAFTDP